MSAAADAVLDSLKDKKVAVGGIFVVAENARYSHWLSNDELGKIIAAHGGKPQLAAINTATDVVILGDVGARDIKWAGGKKAEALAAELELDGEGKRKKGLQVIHFGAIMRSQEAKDASVTCEFKQNTHVRLSARAHARCSRTYTRALLTRAHACARARCSRANRSSFLRGARQAYKKPGEERTRGQLMNILISAAPGAHFEPIRGLVNLPSYTL